MNFKALCLFLVLSLVGCSQANTPSANPSINMEAKAPWTTVFKSRMEDPFVEINFSANEFKGEFTGAVAPENTFEISSFDYAQLMELASKMTFASRNEKIMALASFKPLVEKLKNPESPKLTSFRLNLPSGLSTVIVVEKYETPLTKTTTYQDGSKSYATEHIPSKNFIIYQPNEQLPTPLIELIKAIELPVKNIFVRFWQWRHRTKSLVLGGTGWLVLAMLFNS